MGSFRIFLSAVLLLPLTVAAATGPRSGQWAHIGAALQPDARVVWGQLDNGMRYALLPHKGVPGRVAMRFVVLSGSIDETDSELGIAHYIEHLAFRSSKHFTADEKTAFFQRLGMEAGSDINAITTFDYTSYMLDFRETTTDLLRQGLLLFRDVADGVLFQPPEINKERGVILSELRDRGGLSSQQGFASYPVLFKGLRFPERVPGGKPENIRSFQREDFVRYYERCYRSDLMVLVASGDFDPAELTGLIRQRFDSMVRPTAPIPTRDEGRVDLTKSLRAGVYKITDIGSVDVLIGCPVAPSGKPDSKEAHIEHLRREFTTDLLSERLRKAAGGQALYERIVGNEAAIAWATIDPDDWVHGLGVIDDVIRFTHQKGFEAREIDMIKRRYTTLSDFMLDQKDTVDPSVLAEGLVDSLTEHTVYVGFATEYQWMREWLGRVSPREVSTTFQSIWDLERMAYHLAGDVDIEGGGGEVVRKIQEGRRGGLRFFRPETRKEAAFEMKKWGTPTVVIEDKEVPELGLNLMRFGNNVRLNFINNRSEPGIVQLVVRVGTGLLEMPENRPALKEFGLQTLLASGTTHFTVEQLSDIIEDHLLYFTFDVDDHDSFTFRGTAATDKVDVCLALITDFLDRPIFETFAHREEKLKALIGRIASLVGMQEGVRELGNHLFKGDPRFTWSGNPNDFLGLSTLDVRNWLEDPLKRGYVEATIVGDISKEAVIKSVSRTLGSLAPRSATKTMLFPPKPVKIAAPPGFQRIEFIGEQHLAEVIGTWPVMGETTVRDVAALHVVAKILQQRINAEIRDELGLAYSPVADFTPFNGFPGFALIQAQVSCDPNESTRIARLVEEIGAAIAGSGVEEGEFIGARGILSGQIRQAFHDGSFLISLVRRSQERPESVDEVIALRNGLIDTVTRDEVNKWARKVLAPINSRTAAIVPKPYIGIFQTDGP